MQDTQRIRALADWCRDWANIGGKDDRARSLSLADFFDKRADELDALHARTVLPMRMTANRYPGFESSVRH